MLSLRGRSAGLLLALVLGSPRARAAGPPPLLLAPGARWEKVVGDLAFGEGPAWHPDGYLVFEDVPANRTLKLDASDKVSVYRDATDGANDLALDGRGRIYFTDPRYSKRENLELDREAVYRIDPDGTLSRIVDTLTRPNGILVTPDGRTLYVADNASPGGAVTLTAFDLDAHGNAAAGRVLYDFGGGRGIDGMTLDGDGRIWATAGTTEKAGIYVLAPDAKRTSATLLTVIPMPEDPTNCTFGGARRDVLYVTTTSSLFRIQTAVRGQASPPGK